MPASGALKIKSIHRQISAVIFDMDGVIVDSELQWKLAEKEFLIRWAPNWRQEDYQHITGLSPAALYDYLNKSYGMTEGPEVFLQDCKILAETIYKTRVSLTEGIIETLSQVKNSRQPAAIASSSPHSWIEMVVERFKIASFFDAVVSADDVGGRAKPLPDIYLAACSRLGLPASSCAAIEDSRVGVLAAKSAGLFCLALRNGANGDQDLSAADVEITRVKDSLRLLGIS